MFRNLGYALPLALVLVSILRPCCSGCFTIITPLPFLGFVSSVELDNQNGPKCDFLNSELDFIQSMSDVSSYPANIRLFPLTVDNFWIHGGRISICKEVLPQSRKSLCVSGTSTRHFLEKEIGVPFLRLLCYVHNFNPFFVSRLENFAHSNQAPIHPLVSIEVSAVNSWLDGIKLCRNYRYKIIRLKRSLPSSAPPRTTI